jgi:sulfide:quinone oxidoreductase
MSNPSPGRRDGAPPRLVIVGGGVAALEAMLALRDLAGERVEIELHAPERKFAYRPLLVGKPFGTGKVIEFDLDELARPAGAALYRDSVVAVEPRSSPDRRPRRRADPLRLPVALPGRRAAVGGAGRGDVLGGRRRR